MANRTDVYNLAADTALETAIDTLTALQVNECREASRHGAQRSFALLIQARSAQVHDRLDESARGEDSGREPVTNENGLGASASGPTRIGDFRCKNW